MNSPPPSFVCAFFPPTKGVISAASAVSRDFIVELISHSMPYKHKMPAQICQASSLLPDSYLSVPSLPIPCLLHSPLSPGQQVTHCQCCAKTLLQVQLPSVAALPGVILPLLLSLGRGNSSGTHTPAQADGGSEGQKIIPEDSPGCTPPSG